MDFVIPALFSFFASCMLVFGIVMGFRYAPNIQVNMQGKNASADGVIRAVEGQCPIIAFTDKDGVEHVFTNDRAFDGMTDAAIENRVLVYYDRRNPANAAEFIPKAIISNRQAVLIALLLTPVLFLFFHGGHS